MSLRGAQGFDQYYQEVYGSRWPDLRAALLRPVQHAARLNKFCFHSPAPNLEPNFSGYDLKKISEQFVLVANSLSLEITTGRQHATSVGSLLSHYYLDLASVYAAVNLEVQEGDRVLDFCAAPGGKTLILAEGIGSQGALVANEMSDRRRVRLKKVLHEYLPADLLNSDQIAVTGHDATKWCLYEPNAYDRILVDAPCSGERHLLENLEELKLWSQARSKNLAVRQYALLTSALGSLKVGGRVLYSTCSISPRENDEVIKRLLKKREGEVKVLAPRYCDIGESTEVGWSILPDTTGWGPIYFSIVEKLK